MPGRNGGSRVRENFPTCELLVEAVRAASILVLLAPSTLRHFFIMIESRGIHEL